MEIAPLRIIDANTVLRPRSAVSLVLDRSGSMAEDAGDGLTLRITSFSYRKGYPEDTGGHGGGFVFDCRALPNPGRDVAYRDLCGLHEPVIRYLESREESATFWRHVRSLVEAQVEEYLRRGFGDGGSVVGTPLSGLDPAPALAQGAPWRTC